MDGRAPRPSQAAASTPYRPATRATARSLRRGPRERDADRANPARRARSTSRPARAAEIGPASGASSSIRGRAAAPGRRAPPRAARRKSGGESPAASRHHALHDVFGRTLRVIPVAYRDEPAVGIDHGDRGVVYEPAETIRHRDDAESAHQGKGAG